MRLSLPRQIQKKTSLPQRADKNALRVAVREWERAFASVQMKVYLLWKEKKEERASEIRCRVKAEDIFRMLVNP